jgi:hypothetical protein
MSSKAWQIAALTVAVIAAGAGVYGSNQHNEVTWLTAQLGMATSDAKQAHDTASNLSTQLAVATADAKQAHSAADVTAAQATAEQQQLQTTEAKLAAEARPDLPVNLTFRKALLNAGLVGVFRNTSSKELEFTIDLESAATGRHIRKAVVLNPNAILQIGAHEGWPFAPGQRYSLNNPAFRPVAGVVGS